MTSSAGSATVSDEWGLTCVWASRVPDVLSQPQGKPGGAKGACHIFEERFDGPVPFSRRHQSQWRWGISEPSCRRHRPRTLGKESRRNSPPHIACRDLCSTQAAQARHLPSQPGRLHVKFFLRFTALATLSSSAATWRCCVGGPRQQTRKRSCQVRLALWLLVCHAEIVTLHSVSRTQAQCIFQSWSSALVARASGHTFAQTAYSYNAVSRDKQQTYR